MEQLTDDPSQGDIYLLGGRSPFPLVPDPVHFGVKNLMEVLAKGDDAEVSAAEALLLLKAAGRLPDQHPGLVQGVCVRPGSIGVHGFQCDQFDAFQVRNVGLEVVAGREVDDGQRTSGLLPPSHKPRYTDSRSAAAASDQDVRLPDGRGQLHWRERRSSPDGDECLGAAGPGEHRDI
jgi:hypothetical protein